MENNIVFQILVDNCNIELAFQIDLSSLEYWFQVENNNHLQQSLMWSFFIRNRD